MTDPWTHPSPAPQPPWPGPDVTPFVPWDVHQDGRLIFMRRGGVNAPGALQFIWPPGEPDETFEAVSTAIGCLEFSPNWFDQHDWTAEQEWKWLRAHCEYVVPF